MNPDESGGSLLNRFLWAAAGGIMVTMHNLGADYQAGRLTRGLFWFRIASAPLMVFIAVSLAKYLGLRDEMNGVASIVIFWIGRDGLTYLAKAWAAKWLGVAMQPPTTQIFAAPGTTTHVPHSAPSVDVVSVGPDTPQTFGEVLADNLSKQPRDEE